MFWSVSHHFSVKSGQSVGVFLTSQIIYMCRRLLCCHQISRMNLRVSLQLQFSKHLICKHSWQKKHFTMGLHLSNDCAVSHILKHDCKNIAEMQSEQIFLILDVPFVWDHNSKTKAQIKKLKTCGPLFLYGQQNIQKKFWSESHRFGVKSGQSVGGNFAIAGYRSSQIRYNGRFFFDGR